MNGDDDRDCGVTWPVAEGAHASDVGQGFERGSPQGPTTPPCLECGPGQYYVPPTGTSFPNIPAIERSSEIYPPDSLLTTTDQHVLTGLPATYIPATHAHGKVFLTRLRDNPNDNIYTLKTIPKVSLVQRRVAEVTKELWILRFITDASLSNKKIPFIQKLKRNFEDGKNIFIVLEYFPMTLAQPEMARPFRLSRMTTPPGLMLSPLKMYQSEQEAIQALWFLAAELTLGLLFLHRHGIVHQDIKPANIMILEGGHVVIGEHITLSH